MNLQFRVESEKYLRLWCINCSIISFSQITIYKPSLWLQKNWKWIHFNTLNKIHTDISSDCKTCDFIYHDKDQSFTMNLQKSQFIGMLKSRTAHVLYLITEDVAVKMNNRTIYKQKVNAVWFLKNSHRLAFKAKKYSAMFVSVFENIHFGH